MGMEMWRVVDNYVHIADLDDGRPGWKREVFDMLFQGVVLNWHENQLWVRYGQKLHEIFDIGELDDEFITLFLSRTYSQARTLDYAEEYVKYRRLFINHSEAFVKKLSRQMEKDKKYLPG